MIARLACAVLLAALPAWVGSDGLQADTRAYNLAHGRVVFTDKCMRCHESGRRGAPVVGDTDDWVERLDQPLEQMIWHAIDGHGDMPARGDQDLSDQDVAAAVAFVVHRAREIAARDLQHLPPTAAVPGAQRTAVLSDDAAVHMLLLLLNRLDTE